MPTSAQPDGTGPQLHAAPPYQRPVAVPVRPEPTETDAVPGPAVEQPEPSTAAPAKPRPGAATTQQVPVTTAEPQQPPSGQQAPAQPIELPVLSECSQLRQSMHVLVQQAPHMIIVYALRDGSIRYANTATAMLLGRPAADLIGANVFEVLAIPDTAADPTDTGPDSPSLLPGEYPARLPDGSVHYLDVRSAPVVFGGERCGHVVAWDVTARVERERDLIRQASYDELTGLPNAAHAYVYLEQSLRRLERSGQGCVAVILIDLDGFKQVNDTHGHQVGDVLLQETASRIRATTRDTDLAARLHGDEFLVVQSVANPIHAAYVSERLRTVLAYPIEIDGLGVQVSASVGVAVADPGSSDPHHLLQFADHRMYTDKQRRAGRNR